MVKYYKIYTIEELRLLIELDFFQISYKVKSLYSTSNETEKRYIKLYRYLILGYDLNTKYLQIIPNFKDVNPNLIKRTSIHLCNDILNILSKINLNDSF